jgi:hypothetical protein
VYDRIGNLIQNNENGTNTDITWDVYNKVKTTINPQKSQFYFYDAAGNRVTTTFGSGTMTHNYYVRDPQGNVLYIYRQNPSGQLKQAESHLYGSSRVGIQLVDRISTAINQEQGSDYLLLSATNYPITLAMSSLPSRVVG